jgi:hypothetical protein
MGTMLEWNGLKELLIECFSVRWIVWRLETLVSRTKAAQIPFQILSVSLLKASESFLVFVWK